MNINMYLKATKYKTRCHIYSFNYLPVSAFERDLKQYLAKSDGYDFNSSSRLADIRV